MSSKNEPTDYYFIDCLREMLQLSKIPRNVGKKSTSYGEYYTSLQISSNNLNQQDLISFNGETNN